MATDIGFQRILGELFFDDEERHQSWLDHRIEVEDYEDLGGIYWDLHEVGDPKIADVLAEVRTQGARITSRAAAVGFLYDLDDDAHGYRSRGLVVAIYASARFGANGLVFVTGGDHDFALYVQPDFVDLPTVEEWTLEDNDAFKRLLAACGAPAEERVSQDAYDLTGLGDLEDLE